MIGCRPCALRSFNSSTSRSTKRLNRTTPMSEKTEPQAAAKPPALPTHDLFLTTDELSAEALYSIRTEQAYLDWGTRTRERRGELPTFGQYGRFGNRPGTLSPLRRPLDDHRRHRTSRRHCEDPRPPRLARPGAAPIARALIRSIPNGLIPARDPLPPGSPP